MSRFKRSNGGEKKRSKTLAGTEELFNILRRAGDPGAERPGDIAQLVRTYLDKGLSKDATDEKGTRMLHLASKKGLTEVLYINNN